jgi:hypothetical protein
MTGSKKGEHRGNARKRPRKPAISTAERFREFKRTHETPNEIMRAQLHNRSTPTEHVMVERRITVARIINGPSGRIEDLTPREVMLLGMHHHMQAIQDFKLMLDEVSQEPITPDTVAKTNAMEAEIERLYDKAGEFARNVAPFIHPKQQVIATNAMLGQNQMSILQELCDEIDELERRKPIPIEHKPQKVGG